MLYILGGLPGSGKTSLARQLAGELKAVHLRVDTIEQAFREAGGKVTGQEGYIVAYRLAQDNLILGLSVIADTVNPLQITRFAWREVADRSRVPFVEIEIICSNQAEHQSRVENRTVNIEGFHLPTWNDVVTREYEPWETAHIVIDTADKTQAESFTDLKNALANKR